jgi:methylated-DNA-[protein]-cysteine S-methyltransferase
VNGAGYHLFETALGTCALAWGPRGLVSVQLPEATREALVARLAAKAPDAKAWDPPPWVRDLADAVRRHLAGERVDYGGVRLDAERVPPFHRAVYEASRAVCAGETITYGALAARVGSPGGARAVGQAMARNPWPVVVPCHRVLARDGRAGGFSAYGGVVTKARLLEVERVRLAGSFQPSLTPRMGAAGFDADAALKALSRADAKLGALIARVGAFTMTVEQTTSVYEAVARAIVYQQLTGKAAETIYKRVVALTAGDALPSPEALLAIEPARLRAAGLSNAKMLALRDLAEKARDGAVPTLAEAEALDDEALVDGLTRVRGVGRWTVEMLLMFRLGRADVLPVGDFGVRNGFRIAYGLSAMPDAARLARQGARWAPYRSVASWYLWRAVDRAREVA